MSALSQSRHDSIHNTNITNIFQQHTGTPQQETYKTTLKTPLFSLFHKNNSLEGICNEHNQYEEQPTVTRPNRYRPKLMLAVDYSGICYYKLLEIRQIASHERYLQFLERLMGMWHHKRKHMVIFLIPQK